MTMKRMAALMALSVIAAVPAAAQEQHALHAHAGAPGHGEAVRLIDGLGEWTHTVSTRSELAQRYFDQGLNLAYGFNHDEAVRSFEEAARLDPSCAMCYWGVGYALGPNINLPMEAAAEQRAVQAMREALRLAPQATARERAYIEALAVRYGTPAGAARSARDTAYADAMRRLAADYPFDADALTLYADAMMNLRPWDQWTRAGDPQPGTLEVVEVLERAIRLAPTHAGACHFYVHAVEASQTPERALPCAAKLPRLMPGAGHVVHMPAHIYLRVGLYEEAARANIAAVEADRRYMTTHSVAPGIYPMFYAPHNLHFLWAAYMLSGQRARALGAADALLAQVSFEDAREAAALEGFLPSRILTHVRFGDWAAVLREPAPPAELLYTRAMWHYARGLAHSALMDAARARVELDSLSAIAGRVTDDVVIILNPAPALLAVAVEVLNADLELRAGRIDEAVTRYREAVRLEDALNFDEPPPWYHSARNMLGGALLHAGRTTEAEAAFSDDLRFVRENGWSLSGLALALRSLGRPADAESVEQRLAEAWRHADVQPAVRH